MDKIQFELLRKSMSAFAKANFFMYSDMTLDKKPCALFCSVILDAKKIESLDKVKNLIDENKYPFTIDCSGYERTKHFLIRF